MHEPEKATEKAKDLVKSAVAKAALLKPLEKVSVDMNSTALVMGGGVSGMTAALELASQCYVVHLIEREAMLGGNLRRIHYTLTGENPQTYLEELIEKINKEKLIHVHTSTQVNGVEGYVGNFTATTNKGEEIKSGVIIVATGAHEYKPEEYLYGRDERVVTQLELEEKLPEDVENIVMIQCVGSRNDKRPYCSRICCSDAIKNALKIKEKNPKANVFIIYRDVRAYGFNESYYKEAREKGVLFIRYDEDNPPKVTGDLEVEVFDQTLWEKIVINADLLVLSPAIIPQEDNKELSKMLKVPLTSDGS